MAGPAAKRQHCWLHLHRPNSHSTPPYVLSLSLALLPALQEWLGVWQGLQTFNEQTEHSCGTPVIHHSGLLPGKYPASIWNGRNCNCWMC